MPLFWLLGGVAITLSLEPALTLVLIAALPLLGAVVWLVSRKGIRLYTRTQEALDSLVRQRSGKHDRNPCHTSAVQN